MYEKYALFQISLGIFLTGNLSGLHQFHNNMTELVAGREVRAPHVFEVGRDVPAVEQTLALQEVTVFLRLILSYECSVGIRSVNLDRLVVTKQLDPCWAPKR